MNAVALPVGVLGGRLGLGKPFLQICNCLDVGFVCIRRGVREARAVIRFALESNHAGGSDVTLLIFVVRIHRMFIYGGFHPDTGTKKAS